MYQAVSKPKNSDSRHHLADTGERDGTDDDAGGGLGNIDPDHIACTVRQPMDALVDAALEMPTGALATM